MHLLQITLTEQKASLFDDTAESCGITITLPDDFSYNDLSDAFESFTRLAGKPKVQVPVSIGVASAQ